MVQVIKVTHTLGDGSKVFNIELHDGTGAIVVLCAVTEADADQLGAAIIAHTAGAKLA